MTAVLIFRNQTRGRYLSLYNVNIIFQRALLRRSQRNAEQSDTVELVYMLFNPNRIEGVVSDVSFIYMWGTALDGQRVLSVM